ncbi:MAG: CHAT domain-containing protein [Actinomycetota bacterium]
MTDRDGGGTTDDDRDLIALANSDPLAVLERVLEEDGAGPSDGATPGAWRAAAVAHHVLGDLAESLETAREGRRRAMAMGDRRTAALCDVTSAPVLAQLGRVHESLTLLNDAVPELHDLDLAELQFQRSGVLGLLADYRAALAESTSALETFRQHEATSWTSDALMNRGLLAACLGEVADAERDLREARSIFEAEGDAVGVAIAEHNLALAELMDGRPIEALDRFETSNDLLADVGFPFELFLADHCEALLAVGCRTDAIDLAVRGVQAQEGAGSVLEAAAQRLTLARALAATGDYRRAADHIARAQEAFAEQGQHHRARRAALTELSIGLAAGRHPVEVADAAAAIATYFGDEADLPEWHLDALLLQARALVDGDRADDALAILDAAATAAGSFPQEVERRRVEAEAHAASDRPDEALTSAEAGLALIDRARSQTSSSELDDALTRHVVAFSDIGLAMLLTTERPAEALRFADQVSRARALAEEAPPPEPLLVEYRALGRAIDDAENEGRDPTPIRRRRRELATRIRRQHDDAAGSTGDVGAEHRADDPADDLPGDTTLRRYVTTRGQVWALDRHGEDVTATGLGEVTAIDALTRELLFRTRTALSSGFGDLEATADRLDEALGFPGRLVGTGRLALAVDGTMPGVPFGLLPSLQEAPWLLMANVAATARTPATGPPVFVAGPDLGHGEDEVARLAAQGDEAVVVSADGATVTTVLDAIDGASRVHIAAHSFVNDENPMFSAVRLTDGDLTLHDVGALAAPPSVVVLASCESAATAQVGMSSLGLAQGLLRAGVSSVIGTACTIPDTVSTVDLMATLHDGDVSDVADAVRRVRCDTTLDTGARLIARCLIPVAARSASAPPT